MARIGWYVLGSVLVGYGVLQVLGRRAGSTAEERRMRMPGDELVAQPHIDQPRDQHRGPASGRVAVAHADGLAPGRLVHAGMG